MVKALFDTNILIDHLRGITAARDEIARYDTKAISIITATDSGWKILLHMLS